MIPVAGLIAVIIGMMSIGARQNWLADHAGERHPFDRWLGLVYGVLGLSGCIFSVWLVAA